MTSGSLVPCLFLPSARPGRAPVWGWGAVAGPDEGPPPPGARPPKRLWLLRFWLWGLALVCPARTVPDRTCFYVYLVLRRRELTRSSTDALSVSKLSFTASNIFGCLLACPSRFPESFLRQLEISLVFLSACCEFLHFLCVFPIASQLPLNCLSIASQLPLNCR